MIIRQAWHASLGSTQSSTSLMPRLVRGASQRGRQVRRAQQKRKHKNISPNMGTAVLEFLSPQLATHHGGEASQVCRLHPPCPGQSFLPCTSQLPHHPQHPLHKHSSSSALLVALPGHQSLPFHNVPLPRLPYLLLQPSKHKYPSHLVRFQVRHPPDLQRQKPRKGYIQSFLLTLLTTSSFIIQDEY
jgi:hypothetical protein